MTYVRAAFLGILMIQCSASIKASEIRRAIVIGINTYRTYAESDQLKYASADARGVAVLLAGPAAGESFVKPLYNEEATREKIWDAVAEVKAAPRPDTLFIFFSGHAELDPLTEQYYLMPSDGDRQRLEATAIPATQFMASLRGIGAKTLVIFLDACHSGALDAGKGTNRDKSVADGFNKIVAEQNETTRGSIMLFVSASRDQLSWEDDESSRGVFTRFLIEGLDGKADGIDGSPKDKRITA